MKKPKKGATMRTELMTKQELEKVKALLAAHLRPK